MSTRMRSRTPPTQKELVELCQAGWHWQGEGWLFWKSGEVHDLKWARLDKLEELEKSGLFAVKKSLFRNKGNQ